MPEGKRSNTAAARASGMALVIVALATTGCHDSRTDIVPVSGTVTIDGKPLALGQIRVFAEGHRPSIGNIERDGAFALSCFTLGDGAHTGTHIATVSAVEEINERSNRWHAPKKYANKIHSGLWVTVDGPTDDLKIELTWAGSKQSGPYLEKH